MRDYCTVQTCEILYTKHIQEIMPLKLTETHRRSETIKWLKVQRNKIQCAFFLKHFPVGLQLQCHFHRSVGKSATKYWQSNRIVGHRIHLEKVKPYLQINREICDGSQDRPGCVVHSDNVVLAVVGGWRAERVGLVAGQALEGSEHSIRHVIHEHTGAD